MTWSPYATALLFQYHCGVPEIKPKISIKVNRVQRVQFNSEKKERQKETETVGKPEWLTDAIPLIGFLEHVSICDKSKTHAK